MISRVATSRATAWPRTRRAQSSRARPPLAGVPCATTRGGAAPDAGAAALGCCRRLSDARHRVRQRVLCSRPVSPPARGPARLVRLAPRRPAVCPVRRARAVASVVCQQPLCSECVRVAACVRLAASVAPRCECLALSCRCASTLSGRRRPSSRDRHWPRRRCTRLARASGSARCALEVTRVARVDPCAHARYGVQQVH